MSLSLSLQHHGDTEDTSEHISARLCPCLSLISSAWTHRTRVSTSVLTRVLYVLVPVPSTPWGHPGHKRAHRCSLVFCMSLSLSLLNSYMFIVIDTVRHLYLSDCQSNEYILF